MFWMSSNTRQSPYYVGKFGWFAANRSAAFIKDTNVYVHQRPALKIQQYSKISILIIISAEEIKKPLKIFYL